MGTTATNNTQTQSQAQPKAPFKIVVAEHADFVSTTKGEITTSVELASRMNSIFGPVFSDYAGSLVEVSPINGALIGTLFFRDKGEPTNGKVRCIVPIGTSKNANKPHTNNIMSKIDKMHLMGGNAANTQQPIFGQFHLPHIYEISMEAKDGLTEFMPTYGNNPVNWKGSVLEMSESTNNYNPNNYNVIVKVTGIDMGKIMSLIYGTEYDGEKVIYGVYPIRPVVEGGLQQSAEVNYLVQIVQLNTASVRSLYKELGYRMEANFPMVAYNG